MRKMERENEIVSSHIIRTSARGLLIYLLPPTMRLLSPTMRHILPPDETNVKGKELFRRTRRK